MNKLVKLSIVVLLAAALIAWYRPSALYNPVYIHNAVLKVPFLKSFFKYFHGDKAAAAPRKTEPEPSVAKEKVMEPTRVFTKEELAKYKGEDGGDIYLAILGNRAA